jgi:hypothetical protein
MMGQCLKVWGHMEQEVLPVLAQLTSHRAILSTCGC